MCVFLVVLFGSVLLQSVHGKSSENVFIITAFREAIVSLSGHAWIEIEKQNQHWINSRDLCVAWWTEKVQFLSDCQTVAMIFRCVLDGLAVIAIIKITVQ